MTGPHVGNEKTSPAKGRGEPNWQAIRFICSREHDPAH